MTRTARMLLFWLVAALLVVVLPPALGFSWPLAAMAVKAAAIGVVAFGYVKLGRGPASLEGALMIGALWLLLDVIAEIAVTVVLGRRWFELIGSPAAPVLRTGLVLVWITAPALFVRSGDSTAAP